MTAGTATAWAPTGPRKWATWISGESNGDAGDQYTGLNRFGWIVDQRIVVTSSGTARDRFQYGYDRNGNRLYRDNLLDNNFDELYHADGSSNGYDSLNQLLEFQRGPLSDTNSDNIPDTVSSQTRRQVWTMDGQGNFSDVSTDGTGQSRTHDKQNRLTVVASNNLAYDSNGNMTTDETGKTLVYDAWDRFVQFKNGETVVDTFKYDAVGRRVSENPGTTRDLYYTAGWQVIEERISGTARAHNIWSPVYVDAMVFRYRDSDSNGTLDERLYVMQDANFNVTGLTDTSGAVQERYVYDPYGTVTYLTGAWGSRSASSYGWVYNHQGLRLVIEVSQYHTPYRDLSPSLQRWSQQDPVPATNLYVAYGNGPVNHLDPSGLYPTKEGARSLTWLMERVRKIEKPFGFPYKESKRPEVLRAVARAVQDPEWSYIYTDYGWLDLIHVFLSANQALLEPLPAIARGAGEAFEFGQMVLGPALSLNPVIRPLLPRRWHSAVDAQYASGYSAEDIASNTHGTLFSQTWRKCESLETAVERYFTTINAERRWAGIRGASHYADLPQDEAEWVRWNSGWSFLNPVGRFFAASFGPQDGWLYGPYADGRPGLAPIQELIDAAKKSKQ